MFNMPRNSSGNAGYQLRIHYNAETKKYYLSGYVVFKDNNNRVTYDMDMDGASLQFDSLEATIMHITEYAES